MRRPCGASRWARPVGGEAVQAAMKWSGDPKRLNGGGPIWAIFDAEAVKARRMDSGQTRCR